MKDDKFIKQSAYNRQYKKEHYSRIIILIKKDNDPLQDRLKRYCIDNKATASTIGYVAIDEFLMKQGY